MAGIENTAVSTTFLKISKKLTNLKILATLIILKSLSIATLYYVIEKSRIEVKTIAKSN